MCAEPEFTPSNLFVEILRFVGSCVNPRGLCQTSYHTFALAFLIRILVVSCAQVSSSPEGKTASVLSVVFVRINRMVHVASTNSRHPASYLGRQTMSSGYKSRRMKHQLPGYGVIPVSNVFNELINKEGFQRIDSHSELH